MRCSCSPTPMKHRTPLSEVEVQISLKHVWCIWAAGKERAFIFSPCVLYFLPFPQVNQVSLWLDTDNPQAHSESIDQWGLVLLNLSETCQYDGALEKKKMKVKARSVSQTASVGSFFSFKFYPKCPGHTSSLKPPTDEQIYYALSFLFSFSLSLCPWFPFLVLLNH